MEKTTSASSPGFSVMCFQPFSCFTGLAVLPVTSKSVQYGKRPVLIVQNDIGNEMSPTTIVAPITSRIKRNMPTHVIIGPETGLKNESVVLCEQLVTVNISTLSEKIGEVTDKKTICAIDDAIACSLGLK